jgi:UbiD family decarboxylase
MITVVSQSLRAYLDLLDERGGLRRIRGAVDRRFEVAAHLSLLEDGPALLFERIAGSDMPLVGNVVTGPERLALAVGADPGDLPGRLVAALERPVPPVAVERADWHERTISAPQLDLLPIPTFFEHETGAYLTAAAIVARDPDTGRRNWSIARIKPLGGSRAMVGIAPNHHLAVLARGAAAKGRTLPIAVCLGLHPALLVAACYYLPLGADELEPAGALMGAPVELAPCATIPLEAPAHAELVLEGELDPTATVEEGPVSEFHGMYERYGPGMVVEFAALGLRPGAMLQAILPGRHREHVFLGAAAIAAGLRHALAGTVPEVCDVAVPAGGMGRTACVIALGPHDEGAARRVVDAALAAVNLIKHVTVVDDDIDVRDPTQVAWAVATRMRPERDLVVLEGSRADRAEPLERGGTVTKLGIDATRRAGDRDFTPAEPPAAAVRRVRARLAAEAAG